MPSTLAQNANDAGLLQGRELGEEPRALGALGQLGIGERIDVGAGEHVAGVDAHLLADGGGDGGVVAGEDLDAHAQAAELLHRGLGARLGRIEKR